MKQNKKWYTKTSIQVFSGNRCPNQVVKRNKRRGRLCRHCRNVNDRGKQLCEALGTALATDENSFYLFFLKHGGFTFYEEDKSNEDT